MTQRAVYLVCAFAAALLSAAGLDVSPAVEVSLLAVAVLALGVPHGALDVLHARRAYTLDRPVRWGVFLALYIALAAAVVWAWVLFPGMGLCGLLVISAFHFSGDLGPGSPAHLRVVHGLAPICLPALLHADALADLFAALAPAEISVGLASGLAASAGPLLAATAFSLAVAARKHRSAVVDVAATAAVCTLTSPLLGFGVYFCLLHSWRHVARTARLYEPSTGELVWGAALPTLATAAAAALALSVVESETWTAGVLQVVFIGLAALTVPHMVLIERIRFAGWVGTASADPR